MKPREMRLRLVVRRHALPETRIILPVSLDEEPSIADLIELVNGVVPLESDDWGLEDYVAELHDGHGNAFDLLHFQRVASVIKPDEEVFIRPLLTNDRRQRRLGGRDQITNDGRHLIDGVPFGRPRFKPPRSRPSISIPPLKRRKISDDLDEDVDNDEEDDDDRRRKTPSVRFYDEVDDESDVSDISGTSYGSLKQIEDRNEEDQDKGSDNTDDDDEDDDDFVGDAEDDQDDDGDPEDDSNAIDAELEKELADLEVINKALGDDERSDNEEEDEEQSRVKKDKNSHLPILTAKEISSLTLVDLDRITALRSAFPTASVEVCQRTLIDSHRKEKAAYKTLKKQHRPSMTFEEMVNYFGSLRGGYLQTMPDTEDDAQSVASNADSADSFVKHYDQHGFPAGSILAGTAATHLAETLRKSGQVVKLPVHTRFEDGSDEVGNAEDNRGQIVASEWNGFDEGPESDESSSSDSDAGPEEESSKPPEDLANGPLDVASSSDSSSESDTSSDDDSDSDSDSDSGSSSESSSESNAGVNSDDDSDDDVSFHGRSASSSDSSSEDSSDSDSDSESDTGVPLPSTSKPTPSSNDASVKVVDVQASPQLLPAAPATICPVPPKQGLSKTQRRNARRRVAKKVKRLQTEHGVDADVAMDDQASASGPDSTLAKRKAALIASLGVATSGEDDIVTPATALDNVEHARASYPSTGEESEPWRKKITYRAVECCQEGIELSEPPFPFYQRWDPQQQKRPRSSKRKQRDQSEYYEEDSQSKKKRMTNRSRRSAEDEDEDTLWDASYASAGQYDDSNIVLNYDEETGPVDEDMPDAATSQQDTEDDLPPLPSDLSSLPLLGPGDAKPGMILTWKQIIMSKATGWAPQVFSLTGSVIDVYDDGSLRLLLAKRDRGFDRNDKQYDQDGNRIYDKFEFPGMDDEVDEDMELGYRTLDLIDMMETRILQQPQQDMSPTSPSSQRDSVPPPEQTAAEDVPELEGGSNKSISVDQSTTLDHEDGVIPESQARTKSDTQQSGETGSIVPETNDSNLDRTNEPQAPLLNIDEDVTMTEDRRREISQLINDAGFRKEVDPSIGENMHKPPSVPSSSPSRQLEENLKEAVSAAGHQIPHLSSFSNPSQEVSQSTSISSMSVDSQPVILEPFHGFSDGIEEEPSQDPVEYPALDLPPSDIGSTHSGRQPDPDYSIELGNTSPYRLESVAEESFPPPRARTPTPVKEERKPKKVSPAKSDSSTNSFPSLSEIFLTASTQVTQSSTSQEAISSALKARKSNVTADFEYEEAMRKLDDGYASSEEEASKLNIKRSPNIAQSLKKPIERPALKRVAVKEEVAKAPAKTTKTVEKMAETSEQKAKVSTRPVRTTRKSDPFVIPAGSQVVSLISSSPEPALEENYADDDVDETYEADSFPSEHDSPSSPGWGETRRNRRGASMPLSALASSKRGNNVPKRLASSQGGKLGRSSLPPQKQNKKKTTIRGW